jgi:hypothetical protein
VAVLMQRQEAEKAGEAGNVDLSIKLMEEVEAIKIQKTAAQVCVCPSYTTTTITRPPPPPPPPPSPSPPASYPSPSPSPTRSPIGC